MTITFADLISKYDIVVQSMASLRLQISNITKEPIRCAFPDLKNVEKSERTVFRDSAYKYGGDK